MFCKHLAESALMRRRQQQQRYAGASVLLGMATACMASWGALLAADLPYVVEG